MVATVKDWTEADALARELSKDPTAQRIVTSAGGTQHVYQNGKWVHGSSGWSTR
jgi:hypothetical protein